MTDIPEYYDNLIQLHGASHKALDASSQESLDIRYRILSEVCDMNGKKVLEVGCNFGALGKYLTEKYPTMEYVGIDISEKAIELGHKENPGLNLRHCSLENHIGKYDVVVAQGIFYKLDNVEDMVPMIEQMIGMAEEAVAFCGIDTFGEGDETRIDPIALSRWFCMGVPFVMRRDYLPGDTTFYLYRGK